MKKILPFLLLVFLLTSCLEENPAISSSPHIQSFTFGYHPQVSNLENCKFTVDTINCQIFNEDSLDYYGDLTKLLPYIQFTGAPKTLWVNDVEWNKKDSINFTQPVQLKILSQNGKGEATYTIQVNKHQVNPNEIHWEQLPSLIVEANHTESKVVSFKSTYYLFLTLETGTRVIYSSTDVANWQKEASTDLSILTHSVTAGSQAIYGLEKGGKSICIYDVENKTWRTIASFTDTDLLDILGQFGSDLLITYKATDGTLGIKQFNVNTLVLEERVLTETLPSTFPENGSAKFWADRSLYLIGGMRQGKALTNLIASKNGNYWTDLFHQPNEFSYTPRTLAGIGIYENILFLVGGTNEIGEIFSDFYYSENYGYSWAKATNDMVLPESCSAKYGISPVQEGKYMFLVGGQNNTPTAEVEIWRGILRKTEFIRPDAINKQH